MLTIDNLFQQIEAEFNGLEAAVQKTSLFPSEELVELRTYEFLLNPDPTSTPLSELHKKLAAVSNAKVRVSNIYFDSLTCLGKWQDLEISSENLWNECFARGLQFLEIANLKSDKLRTATVEIQVPKLVKLRAQINKEVQYLERVVKLCKLKLDSLSDTSDSLSRQVTVIDLQVKVGEFIIRR